MGIFFFIQMNKIKSKLVPFLIAALAIWHIIYGVSDPLLLDTPSRFPRLRISEVTITNIIFLMFNLIKRILKVEYDFLIILTQNCPCVWSLLQKHTYLMLVSSPYISILCLDNNIL